MLTIFLLFMKDMKEKQDDFIPHLGMEFQIVDEAWSVWSYYGGRIGFGVRKDFGSKSKKRI
jgi:hypothetical protein